MCGRLNVIDDPLNQLVSDMLGLSFNAKTNTDLCPSQQVATLCYNQQVLQQNANWGIQPDWSKKLLINAKVETVTTKPTFKQAFEFGRCLIPCNGWYEWQTKESGKQKYLFAQQQNRPLFMAGFLYGNYQQAQVVTLTKAANEQCSPYHHRMPLLIDEQDIQTWFLSASHEVISKLADNEPKLVIQSC